ncbi:MAG: NhaA family Na+:H+ antiporter [Myxococcota bacterium]|jgi:NhaA family Na+:H+ antiporter
MTVSPNDSHNRDDGPANQLGPLDRFLTPFRDFAAKKPSGAVLLLAAAVLALLWANSPWASTYVAWLETPAVLGVGSLTIDKPLILWINDGLMAVFFFVVGLEIKREVIAGELTSLKKAAFPLAGAVGGVVVPALIYVALTSGSPAQSGWGVPMATDIAFALGILALLGDRVPLGLKVFLTALAIVDDIVAIGVIGIFYTDSVALGALGIGAAVLGLSVLANRLGARHPLVYFILGFVVWFAFLKSGLHATLAAVLMAFTIPATTRLNVRALASRIGVAARNLQGSVAASVAKPQPSPPQPAMPAPSSFLTHDQHHVIDGVSRDMLGATPPLQRIEHALLPFVTFFVLPVFALANAGVALGGDVPMDWGAALAVALGLLIGKPVGIVGAAWLAVKFKLAELPPNVTWPQVLGVGFIAGVGFTMSLFIGSLAFSDIALTESVKVGVLCGSAVAGVIGTLLLRRALATHTSAAGDA